MPTNFSQCDKPCLKVNVDFEFRPTWVLKREAGGVEGEELANGDKGGSRDV